jgi:CheY-like chemotaxis protein
MADKKRILVVDDEPHLLDMLVDFCDAIDVASIPAATGQEALEKAAAEKPDAITVDNRLPDMLGLDVLAKLKADPVTKDIPVIVLSGDAQTIETEAKKRGAFGVLLKPVTRAGLKQMLEGCIGTW